MYVRTSTWFSTRRDILRSGRLCDENKDVLSFPGPENTQIIFYAYTVWWKRTRYILYYSKAHVLLSLQELNWWKGNRFFSYLFKLIIEGLILKICKKYPKTHHLALRAHTTEATQKWMRGKWCSQVSNEAWGSLNASSSGPGDHDKTHLGRWFAKLVMVTCESVIQIWNLLRERPLNRSGVTPGGWVWRELWPWHQS